MLRKLMKHEFRATGRIMLPLYLVLLITAAGANFATRRLLNTGHWFLNFLGGTLAMAFSLAMIAVGAVAFVLMVQRFWRNLLGDEGYLMLTLPVSVHRQVWAKLIVSAVWFALTILAVLLASFILMYEVGFLRQVFAVVGEALEILRLRGYVFDVTAFALELLAVCFLGSCVLCLQFYAAMAAGHSFANHKKLWSVVLFFALWIVMWWGVLGIVVQFDAMGWDFALSQLTKGMDANAVMHLSMLSFCVMEVLYGSVAYFVTVFCLKRRLNLE